MRVTSGAVDASGSPSPAPPAIDAALRSAAGRAAPGLSVAVVRDGGVGVLAAAGVASAASGRPLRPDTASLWFSMTKIVTATAAMVLAERGALDLDAPAAAFLPELAATPDGRTVLVRHLLNHTSGLANPLPVRWVHRADRPGPDPDRFARDLLRRHSTIHGVPGRRAAYSNLGYMALGAVVERAAGQPFAAFIRSSILQPLGMHDTDFAHPATVDAAVGHQALLHPMTPLFAVLLPRGIVAGTTGRWLRFAPFQVDGPAYGGLIGPTSDAARFLAMHVRDGEYGGARILSPEATRSMRELTAHGRKLDVGLGWYRRRGDRASAEPYVEHLGGGGGFWNMMRLYPRIEAGVLTMGNATAYDHRRIADAALQSL